MSNIIQIKRGSGAPSTEQLAPYELGYSTTAKKIYIHDLENDKIIQLGGGEIVKISNLEITLRNILTAIQKGDTTANTINEIEQLLVSYFENQTVAEVELE